MDTGKPLKQARTDATVRALLRVLRNTIESFYGDTMHRPGRYSAPLREPTGHGAHHPVELPDPDRFPPSLQRWLRATAA